MRSMLSTFVPGFEEIVAEEMSRHIAGLTVNRVMSGMIQYRLGGKGNLPDMPYVNNTFCVLATFPKAKANPVDMMVERVCRFGGNDEALHLLPPKAETFRLVFMVEGKLVSVPPKKLEIAENAVSEAFSLKTNRARPDVEFWLNYREEGIGYFLMRVTRHKDFAKTLAKGELRPDLASLLCLMSRPESQDRVLDPFCGSGAILKARKQWPSRGISGSDLDPQAVKRASGAGIPVTVRDARDLSDLPSGSVDSVITDPPWGIFKPLPDMQGFYSAFLRELRRVVTDHGRVVLLVPRDKAVEKAMGEMWNIVETCTVLVSGRKAQAVLLLPR